MANRDTSKIRKNLKKKGFAKTEGGNHEVYTFEFQGLRTDVFTIISRGSGYKTYGSKLIGDMARQLKLNKEQLLNLIDCPMKHADYVTLLEEKGIIPQNIRNREHE